MFKIVLLVTCSVLCVINSLSDDGYRPGYSRSYTRVKRGKYHPGPPLRFYNRPPITIPIRGPFSYTPPPFMPDDEPPYPGSRPYKVSKRPTNEGLGNDDINNLVKNLSKQDLNKILEFAYETDKYSDKSKIIDYEYTRPVKKENIRRPTYTKDFNKESIDTQYQDEKLYEAEFRKFINYVTEATPVNYAPQDDIRNQYPVDTGPNQVNIYGPQEGILTQYKVYSSQDVQKVSVPTGNANSLTSQYFTNPQAENSNPSPTSFYTDTAEEDKLPPPVNLREEDFDVSYTNNVPTVVKADPSSYQVENFGDLPLMNYNSKLHSVSSYHVPHYTVTESKSQPQSQPAQPSFPSSYSSSSSLLKISPAAASIKAPPFEPAPPLSSAKEQSDAHLKATKIWSHKSKGAAYTLHDDGTLTPEWPRPKYGKLVYT